MSKKVKIIPRGKYILVTPDPEKSRVSDSGIVTPDNIEQEQKAIGTVEAVGSDVKGVKKGDRVIYGAFAGEKIKVSENLKENPDYILLFDEDVLAFIKD